MDETRKDSMAGMAEVMEMAGRTGKSVPSISSTFVAVPAYDAKTFVLCTQTLMNAMQVMMINNVRFEFKFEVGNPYVSAARNQLEAMFMKSDFEQMVFIDADIGMSPKDFLALIMAPEDVVCGAYPKKCDEELYAVSWVMDENRRPNEVNGALEATGGATGAMKIRRSVFDKMREAYPNLKYKDFGDNSDRYNFFGTFVEDRWYGDDFGFCKRWRDIGGQVWILPDMTMIHVGTKNYEGNVYDFMLRQANSPVVHSLCIEGWMSQQELEWLYMTATRMESVAEIGAFKGRTTIALAEACRGRVIAIDHWLGDDDGNKVLRGIYDNEDVAAIFANNVQPYKNVEMLRLASVDAASLLASVGDRVDMTFIDGEHTYESVKADIEAWMPRTRRILCGHDYNREWPGVMKAVNEKFRSVNVVGSIWWVDLTALNRGVENGSN